MLDHHLAHYLAAAQVSGQDFLTPETTLLGITQLLELTNHYGLAESNFQDAGRQAAIALGAAPIEKILFCEGSSIAIIGMLKPNR